MVSITSISTLSIFTTCILLQTHTKSRAICLAKNNESYTPSLNWVYLQTSLRKIGHEALLHIGDSDIRAYLFFFLNPDLDAILIPIQDSPLEFPDDPFLYLWYDPSLPTGGREIYAQALKYLDRVKLRIQAGEESHGSNAVWRYCQERFQQDSWGCWKRATQLL